MLEQQQDFERTVITTTIGDLICAIADAAREASIDESEQQKLTEQVLSKMLKERRS